jgi:hypothetical protein
MILTKEQLLAVLEDIGKSIQEGSSLDCTIMYNTMDTHLKPGEFEVATTHTYRISNSLDQSGMKTSVVGEVIHQSPTEVEIFAELEVLQKNLKRIIKEARWCSEQSDVWEIGERFAVWELAKKLVFSPEMSERVFYLCENIGYPLPYANRSADLDNDEVALVVFDEALSEYVNKVRPLFTTSKKV